jgi:mRNA interferase MazF
VSRQALVDSSFSTLACAPIFTKCGQLKTQVPVGAQEGLKCDSSIYCNQLVSVERPKLTSYVGSLSPEKIDKLNSALKAALDLNDSD